MQSIEGALRVPNNVFFKEVKHILDTGKDVSFAIKGISMLPFLSDGDKVLIRNAAGRELKLGEVILAKSNFGYVLHRLVWQNNNTIWLVGDNNLVQIEKIEKGNILGYVISAESNGKPKDVNSFTHKIFALVWFLLRPIRLVMHYLTKIFKSK